MADGAIFQGEGGQQIKFFIQKDLETKTVKMLHNEIIANGGRIETKIPIQGFVLIEPTSPEGIRLIECWDTPERPFRYFVPYTFIAACAEAQRLIPQVFRRNGTALRMHIHPCIASAKFLETLRNSIWHSGGNPLAAEHEADIVISDENSSGFNALVERFEHFHDIYVETVSWVNQCIESGVYENTMVVKRNLGGRIPGNKRTEFTAADDHHLVRYIACRLPDPETRGRTGNKLYQDLCSRFDLYPWAERHPWQSWRERYKNNAPRFNSLIATYLMHNPLPDGGKGLHGYFRVSSTPLRSQPRQSGYPLAESLQEEGQEVDAEWGSQWSVKVGNNVPPTWGKGKRKASEDHGGTEQHKKRKKEGSQDNSSPVKTTRSGSDPMGSIVQMSDAAPLRITLRTPSPTRGRRYSGAIGTLPSENGLDSVSEGDVIGEETQALIDANEQMLSLKPGSLSKSTFNAWSQSQAGGGMALFATPALTSCNFPEDVMSALAQIACEYRFLRDEVMEEYEELNHDMDATRSLFKEMRTCINERKSRRKKPCW